MDNTIYQESGNLSNGAGLYLFVGRTAGAEGTLSRRALLKFDLERAVPRDARIESVSLFFHTSEVATGGSGTEIFVYRLTSDWGESASSADSDVEMGARAELGDATWTYGFYNTTAWGTRGGDFAAFPSASVSVLARPETEYDVRSTRALVEDVQTWVTDPESNYGWILVGVENRESTYRRLNSRHHNDESTRPRLTITFSTATSSERPDLPGSFRLERIAPNPVGSSAVIRFTLDRPQRVRLAVYDVTGRPVHSTDWDPKAAGLHEIEIDTSDLASGLYVYCLSTTLSSRQCHTMTKVR